ncbi:MAG: hypothetical protein FMNOHCHN_03633 [Ignavibacteriaceae bacterium]|nr:hypothetical protein [Ignavibacteriaceae bacterium]
MILTRLSGLDATASVDALTAAYNTFKSQVSSTNEVLQKLVAVDNASAASMADLAEGVKRVGSVAQLAGQDIDEVIASIAVLQEVTARGGSVIGNSFKTILERGQRLENLKFLENLGVTTKDASGKIKPTIELYTELANILNSPAFTGNKVAVASQLAGNFQINALSAFLDVLKEVDGAQNIYQRTLEKSRKASVEATNQNEKFSTSLAASLNNVDVTIQQVLNSLGAIGIKDPLSSLLDGITEIGRGFVDFIDGDEIGSNLAKRVIKGLGAVLLGPTGIVTVGFAVGKIILDFAKFGANAAKSFLSLNKTAKDQELIQKSILTTISQMPSILNGIENTESGRLLLAQRVSAEYEKQLAAQKFLNNLSAGAASSVYKGGFRVTDKGLTKKGFGAANGYLPDLISSEMRDVRNGVGGASPNSKIVVMPNFPFGGGKKGLMVANSSEVAMKMGSGYGILNPEMMGLRGASGFLAGQKIQTKSGRFASVNNLEQGLDNLVKLLIGMDKSLPEIREAAKNFAKSFQLNEKSLDFVVDASTKYASAVREAQARIVRETNQEAIRKALGKADQTIRSSPEKRAASNIPIIVPTGGALLNRPSPREIQKALQESSLKMIVEAADEANQKIFNGILEKRKQIAEYIKSNPPNPLSVGLSRTSLSGRDISGNPTFAYLNEPIRYRGPTSSDPLTRAVEIGRQREIDRLSLQQRGLSIAPTLVEAARVRQNYQFNPTAAFGGSQRLAAQNLPSSVALPAETINKAKGSLESFAIKAFAVSAIVDVVGAQFRGMSQTTDKFIDALSKATFAAIGFQFLSKKGGLDVGSLLGGLGSRAAGSGKIGSAIGTITSGLASFGRGLLSVVPVLGQIGLVGFAINEFSKVFSDKSIFDRIKESLTGVTEVGEKTRAALEDFSASLYESGRFIGSTREQRITQSKSQRDIALQSLKAQSLGVEGSSPEEIGANLLRKGVETALSNFIISPEGVDYGDFGVKSVLEKVSGDARENLISGLAVLASGTAQEISDDLAKLGVKKIDGQDIDKVSIERAREVLIQQFIEQLFGPLIKGDKVNLQEIFSGNKGKAAIFGYVEQFTAGLTKPAATIASSGRGTFSRAISGVGGFLSSIPKESLENIVKLQSELNSLIVEGAISSLEAQAKSLEFRAGAATSESQKNDLLRASDEIRRRIFSQQLKSAVQTFQTDESLIKASGKEPVEINAELAVLAQKYANQINAINDSIAASKDETDERNRAADSLARFNSSISAIQGTISTLNVRSSVIDAEGQRLRAQSSDPALGILAQENFQRQINANAIASLESQRAIAAAERSAEFLQNERIGDPNQRAAAEKESADKLIARNQAIDAEIDAINESTKQIGSVKSSFVSLNDAILQFTRNLGESRGQNQFNLLQATDASSIVQGLIGERVYGAAEGKSGADLVSFIADQNALLNEQFKIRTATSEVEKVELERQLSLTRELLVIKNSNLSASEKQAQIEAAINANLEKRRTFGAGAKEAFAAIKDQVNNFGNEFGKTTTNAFRDGLSDAIKAAVSQTDNLRDALLDIALAFANKLRDAAIDNLVNSLLTGSKSGGGSGVLGAIAGFFTGTKGFATGGYVAGGSGIRDDIFARLMGGEFVLNKKAVQNVGVPALTAMNNGYFAPGVRNQGSIIGKNNLLDFATQTATGGAGDIRRNLSGGAGLVSLEPESIRASNFQRFGDSPIVQATQEAKEQAFGLYLDQLGQEKQYQEELNRYFEELNQQKKAQKQKITQLLISLGISALGGALSGGFGSGSKETRYSGGRIRGVSERPFTTNSSSISRGFSSVGRGVVGGLTSSVSSNPFEFVPKFEWREMMRGFNAQIANLGGVSGASLLLPPPTYTPYKNSGGYVGGNGDTQPAMLSRKEFVLNSSAAKKLGDKALYALNNGASPSGARDDSAIVAKLDELIDKTASANNISITINSDGSSEERTNENAPQNTRLLAEKISGVVRQVLIQEKRSGGLLATAR